MRFVSQRGAGHGRGPWRLAASLSILVVLAATPASAAAASFEKAIWGPVHRPSGQSAFPIYKRVGVDTFEIQLVWAEVARWRPKNPADPRDPAYRWPAEMRDAVREARRYGIRMAVMVKGTPDWANGGHGRTRPPDDDQDLAKFFSAATSHYPRVRRWMVWGEPGRSANWDPIPPHLADAPRRYATLLDASYAAIKRANPHNIVIGGMTFTAGDVYAPEWAAFMRLPNGKPPRMDWWGHNPFSFRKPDIALNPYEPGIRDLSDVDTLGREVAAAYKGTGHTPRLWLSEFTVSSDRGNRAFGFFVSRDEQADWLTAGFAAAKSLPQVAGMGWYGLYDEPLSIPNGYTFGLLDRTGKRKPAYDAYRRVRSRPPAGS